MATLSRADVEHVAHLARLGLTDEELGRLEGQLNHILDQYEILSSVPTDHIAPTAQTIELENILRDDVARPSLPREAVLAAIAAKNHANGVDNPWAQMRKDLGYEFCRTPSDKNPFVAGPLKRTDCSLVSDGAANATGSWFKAPHRYCAYTPA